MTVWRWTLLGALGVLGIALLVAYDPSKNAHFPKCPFHQLTGWHCPGCGTTRATHQVLHGDFLQAAAYNPILVVALPLLSLMAVESVRAKKRLVPALSDRLSPWILWVVLGYWVLRNIPIEPFSWLAPRVLAG